jgi:acetoin utilization protein AcuB
VGNTADDSSASMRAFYSMQAPGVRAMLISEIMTTRIVSVEMDDKLEVVKQIFESLHFHHLLVIDAGKKLSGIVSDRDLLRAISPHVGSAAETARDLATLNKRVHQIMTRHPFTLKAQATISDGVNLMLEHGISCIPIVDDTSKPVGIVSWRDLLKALNGAFQARMVGG